MYFRSSNVHPLELAQILFTVPATNKAVYKGQAHSHREEVARFCQDLLLGEGSQLLGGQGLGG